MKYGTEKAYPTNTHNLFFSFHLCILLIRLTHSSIIKYFSAYMYLFFWGWIFPEKTYIAKIKSQKENFSPFKKYCIIIFFWNHYSVYSIRIHIFYTILKSTKNFLNLYKSKPTKKSKILLFPFNDINYFLNFI